jgi:hypothetical protein
MVTNDDLRSFIIVRKEGGRADSLVTALYGAHLGNWHRAAGRLEDDEAALFYDAAELYGTLLCKQHHLATTGEPLRADDPDAYRVALGHLLCTYNIPGMSGDTTRWEQERRRELTFTGSSLLFELSASLQDHIYNQLYALYGGTELPKEAAQAAFYTGLVDAAIFADTYARFRHNLPPQHFEIVSI